MGCIPCDPYIALSSIHMTFRDCGGGLQCECAAADFNRLELVQKLKTIGYVYDPELNQFIREKHLKSGKKRV